MSSDSNKYNMKYSAVSNQKHKYFLIHSVLTKYKKACSHEGLLKVMLLWTVHITLCHKNKSSLRTWSTGQTTPGAGDLVKPLVKHHSEEG